MARLWKEYRVGGPHSKERFYICATCERVGVNPMDLWVGKARVYELD